MLQNLQGPLTAQAMDALALTDIDPTFDSSAAHAFFERSASSRSQSGAVISEEVILCFYEPTICSFVLPTPAHTGMKLHFAPLPLNVDNLIGSGGRA
jgi:hypothetical protein